MKIFKFGGASLKDADSVRNVVSVLKKFPSENIIVVVSAMGKITNLLESLVEAVNMDKGNPGEILEQIKRYHRAIAQDLFPDEKHAVHESLREVFFTLQDNCATGKFSFYNETYDQITSQGELISSKIVSAYLSESGLNSSWLDVRNVVKTDATYREGVVDWEKTEVLAQQYFSSNTKNSIVITQGFLGQTEQGLTTTLGREGSDYTAAILAYCTNAESVTIWKDVPGVMNADPKWFDETKLIEHMSYQDAIELAYYGATVIHPKTIKPLQNKKIPLYVRSFLQPDEKGTLINSHKSQLPIPCFIFKVDQLLLSISPKDFSFIVEENFSDIFKLFSEEGVKIQVMQNSAISFSVCVDNNEKKTPQLIKILQSKYRVLYNAGVELITIRYYNQATIDRVCVGKKVFLEHKSRYTVQLVVKNK